MKNTVQEYNLKKGNNILSKDKNTARKIFKNQRILVSLTNTLFLLLDSIKNKIRDIDTKKIDSIYSKRIRELRDIRIY